MRGLYVFVKNVLGFFLFLGLGLLRAQGVVDQVREV